MNSSVELSISTINKYSVFIKKKDISFVLNILFVILIYFYNQPAGRIFGESLTTDSDLQTQNTPSKKPEITFGAGAALWAYDSTYIMELNPEFKFKIPLEKSQFSFDLILPVFIAMVYEKKDNIQNDVFKGFHAYFRGFSSTDYGSTLWPEIVSSPIFLITYIKKATWSNDHLLVLISPDKPQIIEPIKNILWYNPFFDVNTGILNRYLQFTFTTGKNNGAVYTSSLTNPTLFFTYYNFFPFLNFSGDFLQQWSFTPSLWTDLGVIKNPDAGVGFETSTGGVGNEFIRLNFLTDAHFFSSRNIVSEKLSYRFDVGSSLLLRPFGVYAGYIYKSAHHPYGPYLSPLYVSRSQNDYTSFSKNNGILLKILPGMDSIFNFGLDTEIYPANPMTISLKGLLGVKWEKNSIDLAYIHEDISGINDFLDNRKDSSSFIEFHLQYYIVPETLLLEWRHVVNFRDHSAIKTLVSLMAYF
ncbi:MAG: hypothetical protein OEV78_01865 [Spirochaetia bacterium]|nr:hypothetical protein [Spirochaetia bacterium]